MCGFHLGAVVVAASSAISSYGLASGMIAFHFIRCAGTESRLVDCPVVRSRPCSHNEDIGVKCRLKTGVFTLFCV